ncbi:MAG: restriction endonuclease subunit S [Betaproteobacteria bacterium]|nr:restriction endonuclease subunit S [Betaproteobacteria bacterium]
MSSFTPFSSNLPLRPLKFVASLRSEKVDAVPSDGEYLGLEQFESWTGRLSEVELQQPPEGSANVFAKGDVLFGKLRPYLAKGWAADRAGFCTTESLVLRPQEVEPRFLRYCLLTPEFVDAVNGSTYGSKMPRADWSFIGALKVPCPSKLLQERIANFLDEQTARIDALIAEKERLQTALEEWREAELTRICFGGSNASEPTGSVWIQVLPKGWHLARLKHLVIGIEQGWSPECESRGAEAGEWGVLKAGASNGGTYRDTENKALPAELEPLPSLEVRVGDVLVSRASGSADLVGSVAYVYETRSRLMLSDKNFRLQFAENPPLSPELLAWMCNTDALRQQVRQFVSGADGLAKNIGSGSLKELWLAVPPITMQPRLINELRSVKLHLGALEAHLTEHIDRLREYRSSLISAAVTGQLNIDEFQARQLNAS